MAEEKLNISGKGKELLVSGKNAYSEGMRVSGVKELLKEKVSETDSLKFKKVV